jgi:hypothetical protein
MAELTVRMLTLAGFEARNINGVIQVTVDGIEYYVENLPTNIAHGAIPVRVIDKLKNKGIIVLIFDDKSVYVAKLSTDVCINGVWYTRGPCGRYIGHLYDNMYTSFENKWIDRNLYLLCNNYKINIEQINSRSILDANFMPAVANRVNVQNNGLKLVADDPYSGGNHLFTFIHGTIANIVDGVYEYITGDGLFRYLNREKGKTFMYLFDPQTKQYTLANSDETVELIGIDKFEAKKENGLYDEFQINYDLSGIRSLLQVFHYKDIFFILGHPAPIILDARKPGSGEKTKAAVAAVE